MKICFLTFYLLFTLYGCQTSSKNENDISGGSCSYKTDSIPIVLIDTIAINSNEYELVFTREQENSTDTIYYSNMNTYYLPKNEYFNKGIELNGHYILEEKNIISGSCSPNLQSIRLEKITP